MHFQVLIDPIQFLQAMLAPAESRITIEEVKLCMGVPVYREDDSDILSSRKDRRKRSATQRDSANGESHSQAAHSQ